MKDEAGGPEEDTWQRKERLEWSEGGAMSQGMLQPLEVGKDPDIVLLRGLHRNVVLPTPWFQTSDHLPHEKVTTEAPN